MTLANPSVRNLTAILGSVVLNLLLLYGAGVVLLMQWAQRQENYREPVNEVVISLEDLVPRELQPEPAAKPEEPEKKPYIETYADQESAMAPDRPVFESDRNTTAATRVAPMVPSELPTPTQDGEEKIPVVQLQDHKFVDGPDGEIPKSDASQNGAPANPSPVIQMPDPQAQTPPMTTQLLTPESESKRPEMSEPTTDPLDAQKSEVKPGEEGGAAETVEMAKADLPKMRDSFSDSMQTMDERPQAEPAPEEAMPQRNPEIVNPENPLLAAARPASPPLVATPIVPTEKAVAPVQPGNRPSMATNGQADSAAFSPERRMNKMSGSVSNIGRTASVDAEQTPLGQYKKAVSRAIERRWHFLRQENASFVTFGSLKIKFNVDRRGQVHGLGVMHDDASAVVKSFSLQAVMTADIPPMPEEIIDLLGEDPLEVVYDIIIY